MNNGIPNEEYTKWMLECGWMPEQINKRNIKRYKKTMDCAIRELVYNMKQAWNEAKKAWRFK